MTKPAVIRVCAVISRAKLYVTDVTESAALLIRHTFQVEATMRESYRIGKTLVQQEVDDLIGIQRLSRDLLTAAGAARLAVLITNDRGAHGLWRVQHTQNALDELIRAFKALNLITSSTQCSPDGHPLTNCFTGFRYPIIVTTCSVGSIIKESNFRITCSEIWINYIDCVPVRDIILGGNCEYCFAAILKCCR